MSRSTSEPQAALGQLNRARLAAPKPRAKAGLSHPLRVTDPRSARSMGRLNLKSDRGSKV